LTNKKTSTFSFYNAKRNKDVPGLGCGCSGSFSALVGEVVLPKFLNKEFPFIPFLFSID
jgi:hypothetical protein